MQTTAIILLVYDEITNKRRAINKDCEAISALYASNM
jgi:hypothetical protein